MNYSFIFIILLAIFYAVIFLLFSKGYIKSKTKNTVLIVLMFFTFLTFIFNCKNLYFIVVTIATPDSSSSSEKPSFFKTMITIVIPLLINIVLFIFEAVNFYKDRYSIKNYNINFDNLEVIDKGVINSNSSKKCIEIVLTENKTNLTDLYYIKPQAICFQLCLYPDIFDTSWENYRVIKDSEQSECVLRNIVTKMSEVSKCETSVINNQLKFYFSFESEISIIQDLIQNSNDSNDRNSVIIAMDYRILKRESLLFKLFKKEYFGCKTKKAFSKFTKNMQIDSKIFSTVH